MSNNNKIVQFPELEEGVKEKTPPQVEVGTHYFRQLYLYAFAPQAEVMNHLRTQALSGENSQVPKLLGYWTLLQSRIGKLMQDEAGLAETIEVDEIPREFEPKLEAFLRDNLFQKTFSHLPISFRLVEIDKLIAAQRTVNLDYVDKLVASYSKQPTLEDLISICLSPSRSMDPIQHLEVGPNSHVFTSPNSDIRFLGAFVKELTNADLEFAIAGGNPAAAVIAFIGYGGSPVNVLSSGKRVVLNNGFHRVYALRSLGVTRIPVVVQHVGNPQLEFPAQVAGLPREYLLYAARPVLMKDFFEPDFKVQLKVRDRLKMVTVGIGVNQHEVPA